MLHPPMISLINQKNVEKIEDKIKFQIQKERLFVSRKSSLLFKKYYIEEIRNFKSLGLFPKMQNLFESKIKSKGYKIFIINSNYPFSRYKMSMNSLLPQLEPYKQRIPQFILKLYHILEKKSHLEYLTWHDDEQIVIKSPKKFQEKVLPQYFRHKHLSSFIRQLNMYKFNKVPKIIKEKNHLYFRNENFQRGKIENLLKIKRNIKKNRATEETITPEKNDFASDEDNISINQKLQQGQKETGQLNNYKEHVKRSITQIKEIIMSKFQSAPNLEQDFRSVLSICDELLQNKKQEVKSFGLSSSNQSYQQLNLLNISQVALPIIEGSLIFPSQCSLSNFNSFQNGG